MVKGVQADTATIVFSYVGYKDETFFARLSDTAIHIILLEEDAKN